MVGGYAGKLLEVNLREKKTKDILPDESTLKKYIGGRGLAARILWDRIGENWENVDPLTPENPLLILTGPLTGYYPGGRVCVSGKSPQSNGIVGSTVAGEFGMELKCAGYDGLIFTGKAEKPIYLLMKDSEIMFKDAEFIWGEQGRGTIRKITKQARNTFQQTTSNYGKWKEPSILYIGPAGEQKSRMATVMTKITHAAGYGGYGSVMGMKNLKAVAVKGTGPLPEVEDWTSVKSTIDKIDKECFANEPFRRWGTGDSGYTVGADTSSEPIRNWQEEWHNKKEYGAPNFEKLWVKRYWADHGCPVSCMKYGVVKEPPYKGSISDPPDYELQAYMGTNLGIFVPSENMHLSAMVDEYGLCGIQGGNILGFTAELYQRDILTKEDLGGIELEWGNTEAFDKLIKKIVKREGIGDILAEGTFRAARKLSEMKGKNLMKYAVQSKGIAIGAHGIRSGEDYVDPIGYVCSTQGGDHTSPASFEGKEDMRILPDTLIICNFVHYSSSVQNIWDMLEATTGWNLDEEDWETKASRILQIQRTALLLGDPDFQWKSQDKNPSRFYEPLPTGPHKGEKANKKKVIERKQKYYKKVGWDEHGIPTKEKLQELGLKKVNEKLEQLRS